MEMKENRLEVQTELNINMVVEAGAGTGKTTLLIDRLCLAVLVHAVAVEKLVALTFTEKAAAEIKTRFIFKLQKLVETIKLQRSARQKQEADEPLTQEEAKAVKESDKTLDLLRAHFMDDAPEVAREPLEKRQEKLEDLWIFRAETALARLDRSSIGTIHGFCADILKAFPLEAGLTPNAEIDSGQKSERLFDAYWNTFLDKELGENAPRPDKWKTLLPEVSLTDLKKFARQLCSGKIDHYDYWAHAEEVAAVCEAKAAWAVEWSTAYLPEGKEKRRSEKSLIWAGKSLLRTVKFLRERVILPPVEDAKPSFPDSPVAGWDKEAHEEAKALVAFAEKITPENQQLFLTAWELVKDLAATVRAEFAKEGILSFDDLIVKTRNLLQRDFYVRRQLKEKFDVLFVDEFQDTDPVQGELLLFLAEEKSSAAAYWPEVKLAPGKLIVVGDPKQSIYRFRGADITAYELFTDLILQQGGKKCFLQCNFRSVPDIVSTANSVCSGAMVQEPTFQPAYVPIFPTKPAGKSAVEWVFVALPEKERGSEKDKVDLFRYNQGEQIAQWIKAHVGRMKLADGSPLSYRDITILSRATTTSGPYTDALRRHGIPFNVEADKDFYRKQEIHDFLSLLRVVCDPDDSVALTGVLRSPFGGFTDEEIYQIANRGELNLSVTPQDPRLAEFYVTLRHLIDLLGRVSLQEFLVQVLTTVFLPESCAAAYDGEQTLANLNRLVLLAEGFCGESAAGLGQFLAKVEDLMKNHPEMLGAPTSDDALDAVSVMTVHKSKGLQFPVVILADLSKKDSGNSAKDDHIFSWQYNMHGLRVGKIADANLLFLEEEQKKHSRCEEIRVLYVGLTRAKEHMVLVADNRKNTSQLAQAFRRCGLFPSGDSEQKELKQLELTVPVSLMPYQETDEFIFRTSSQEREVPFEHDVPAWKTAFSARKAKYEQMAGEKNLAPSELAGLVLLSEEQRIGAEVGTVCHRALELLVSRKETDAATAVKQAAASTAFAQHEEAAAGIIVPFSKSPLFKQISSCEVLACEMPFSFAQEGIVTSGVIDLLLKKADGTVWALDYKTDRVHPGGEGKILGKYRPQLAVYSQAVQKLFPKQKVICSVVLLRTFAALDL